MFKYMDLMKLPQSRRDYASWESFCEIFHLNLNFFLENIQFQIKNKTHMWCIFK